MSNVLSKYSYEETLQIYKKNPGNRWGRRGSNGKPAEEIYVCATCKIKFRTKEAFRSHKRKHGYQIKSKEEQNGE